MVLTQALIKWSMFICSLYNVEPNIALSVMEVESSYNPNKIGDVGEIGLMQVRPENQSLPETLLKLPATNIMVGVKELSRAKKQCKHQDNYTWIVCYNYGIKGGSRLKHPEHSEYYKKVMETCHGKSR